jgi:hypothetical protein
MKNAFFILLLFCTASADAQNKTRKVLFLGNSYTYFNDLPQMIAELAASAGDTLLYDSHSIGGYTLTDHFASATSLNKILADDWDYIVLQEQSQRPAFIIPSAFMNGFSDLNSYIRANKPCAQITSFMTWGYKNGDLQNCASNPGVCTYDGMQQLVTDRYMAMSELYDAEVTAVGVVWKYIKQNHPTINLYQADESHPTVAGSYVAACSFYASLFRKNPLLITDNQGLNATAAATIRSAAKSFIFDSLSNWYIGKYVPNSNFTYTIGTGINEVILNNVITYRDSSIWDFGDGTTTTTTHPTHSYAANGTYTIKLTSSKCFLGQNLVSTFSRTVNFCNHTPTIFPNLILCPGKKDTIWTQAADNYQWYDDAGVPIPGATNQWLLALAGGTYTVQTTTNGCAEMSAPMFVDEYVNEPGCELGINGLTTQAEVKVIPNPAKNIITIQWNTKVKEATFFDMTGRRVDVISVSEDSYDVNGLAKGIYIIKITTQDGNHLTTRFLKQ